MRIFTAFIVPILLLSAVSCHTTEYLARKPGQNFNNIKPGKTYWVYDKLDRKTVVKVENTDGDSIHGTTAVAEPPRNPFQKPRLKQTTFVMAKKDIPVIKQPHPAGTAAIIAGGVAGGGVLIYYMLEAAKVFGSVVGGIH